MLTKLNVYLPKNLSLKLKSIVDIKYQSIVDIKYQYKCDSKKISIDKVLINRILEIRFMWLIKFPMRPGNLLLIQLKISLSILLVINRVLFYRKSISVIHVKIQDLILRIFNTIPLKMNGSCNFIEDQ